ncbi:response regulator [candidate division KSB1 bacterium]|nr:response regulator [candidate division KSB1 bacterium]
MEKEKTILLIDDDPDFHIMLNHALAQTCYRCLSAYKPHDGLKMILEYHPDIILLDYIMPDLTGEDLYQELVTNPIYMSCRHIPVVILTAQEHDRNIRERLIEGGIQAYLNKPFGYRELKNLLENIFILQEIQQRNLQLQKEISNTKEHLELLVDNTPIGIMATDINGMVTRVNPYLVHILRLPNSSEIVNKNLFEFNPFRNNTLHDSFHKILSEGLAIREEVLEYSTPTNERLILNLKGVPLRNTTGDITGLTLLFQDITDLEKKAYQLSILRQVGTSMQSALDLNELLHLILTAITAGCALGFSRAMLLMLSEDGQYLSGKMGVGPGNASDAYRIWTELSQEHLNLQNFLDKYGHNLPDENDEFNHRVQGLQFSLSDNNCFLHQAIFKKETFKVNFHNRQEHNCQQCLTKIQADEFIIVPLLVKNKVIGVIVADNMYNQNPINDDMVQMLNLFASQAAVAIERTEAYQHLEEEKNKLQEAYIKLEATQEQLVRNEKLAAIGQTAANVAHEIRNPLVTIGGFARILMRSEKIKADEELNTFSQIIAEEVTRLENILKNVLDYVKLTHPEFTLENINQIIEASLLMMSDEIQGQKIALYPELAATLPMINIDPQQFKQVIINVLKNSIYAMKNGGKLFVRSYSDKENVVIEIEDTGKGIPKEIMHNLFIPYFTTKRHGTGLGLAITQQIINAHNGKIDIESEPDRGTIVKIMIPLKNNEIQIIKN